MRKLNNSILNNIVEKLIEENKEQILQYDIRARSWNKIELKNEVLRKIIENVEKQNKEPEVPSWRKNIIKTPFLNMLFFIKETIRLEKFDHYALITLPCVMIQFLMIALTISFIRDYAILGFILFPFLQLFASLGFYMANLALLYDEKMVVKQEIFSQKLSQEDVNIMFDNFDRDFINEIIRENNCEITYNDLKKVDDLLETKKYLKKYFNE